MLASQRDVLLIKLNHNYMTSLSNPTIYLSEDKIDFYRRKYFKNPMKSLYEWILLEAPEETECADSPILRTYRQESSHSSRQSHAGAATANKMSQRKISVSRLSRNSSRCASVERLDIVEEETEEGGAPFRHFINK